MAKVWMRAITGCHIKDIHGNRQSYKPGDWFECGKHLARKLIAEGSAEFARLKDQNYILALGDCGIVVYGGEDENLSKAASEYQLDISYGEPELTHSRTLIAEAGTPLRMRMIPTGFSRLEVGWQLAIPTYGEDIIAEEIGSQDERERTKEVIRHLSVPVYDTRAMFVARCDDTKQLIRLWKEERTDNGNDMLAFLRAYYVAKLSTCQLPAEPWMQ